MQVHEKNKGGRPSLIPGQIRCKTTVSLTKDLQIKFLRLGGSLWLRQQIEKASKDGHDAQRI